MSRKFNMGRQNDLLLNEKMHNLYTHLEFISYKDGNGEIVTMPRQTKQTAIPKGALWLQHPLGSNTHKLRVHTDPEASDLDDRWPCLFEGYYHPITLRDLPQNPVHGQLWVDDQNVLRIYNDSTVEGRWDEVCTKLVADMKYDVFNGLDFQLIDPLLPIELDSGEDLSIYTVPYESFGKYFTAENYDDEYVYCHPCTNLEEVTVPNYNPHQTENTITVDGESDNYAAKAWVHVNPYNLDKVTKRLIKINKPKTYYKKLEGSLNSSVYEETNSEGFIEKYIDLVNDLGETVKTQVFQIVADSTKLVDFEPSYMLKAKTANKSKYQQGMDFIAKETNPDYAIPVVITDQNTGFIPVPNGKTEYYALKSGARGSDLYDNKIGRLLKHYSLKEGLRDDDTEYYVLYDESIHGTKIQKYQIVEQVINSNSQVLYDSIKDKYDFAIGDYVVINPHLNDYEIINGGIILDPEIYENYDYIYAITYTFRANHTIDGSLIRIHKCSLDGPDQMWIGSCAGVPVVFMDGLYLEHYEENGKTIYSYTNENIVFSGNDVLDNMQILVISFPKVNVFKDAYGNEYPQEYTIDENCIHNRYEICEAGEDGALQVVDIAMDESTTTISYSKVILQTPDLKDKIDTTGAYYVKESKIKDAIVKGEPGDSLFDKENFPNPLIFYNGLAGYTFVDNEVHIDYENRTITIHDFGSVHNEVNDDQLGTVSDPRDLSTVFAVSLGENNYKGYGVLEDGVLYDETISTEYDYLVIVDGLVMSPYNDDITIENGKITITDATVALDSECTFIQLTGKDDNLIDDTDAIICIYDDMFTPYSIPIINRNAMNTSNAYDDCDSAVVMCGPGALIDREAIQREFSPDDVFVGGQIVKERKKVVTDDEIYEWRMYTYSNEYVVLDPAEDSQIIQDCENMITYYMNDGTVLLNPVNIDDQPVTVYAYTYVDSVDERLLRGQRLIPIEVPRHSSGKINTYTTNRTHLYDVGVNALSTYINGVMVRHTEKPTTDVKGDLFFIDEQLSSLFVSFINRYRDDKCDNRYKAQDMYNVLMAEGFTDDCTLTSEIKVQTNTGLDHCLVMKYFDSDHQLEQAKKLKKYILNEMKNNSLMYIIENVEHNEFVSCRRQWIMDKNDNGNLPNSYTTTMKMMPGIINVYVNGVLLEKDDYAVFDNNKIMIGFDLVGGQEILPKNRGDYAHPYRVMTDEGFKFIECENDDEVTLEVRDDLTIKKRTYDIKDISYETYSFDIIDYEFPTSLMYTKDIIKIYINGVLYDGNYTNSNGVITLLECDLEEDPLYKYLRMHPSAMKEYEEKYGEYIKHEDTITFEWR